MESIIGSIGQLAAAGIVTNVFSHNSPKNVRLQKNVDSLVKLFMSEALVPSPQSAWRCRPRPGPGGVLIPDDGPVCSLLCCPAAARNNVQGVQFPSNKRLSNIQLDIDTL